VDVTRHLIQQQAQREGTLGRRPSISHRTMGRLFRRHAELVLQAGVESRSGSEPLFAEAVRLALEPSGKQRALNGMTHRVALTLM
jgi:hypothetical protein